MEQNAFDVIIIGGSYAGLSSAMALGRSLRRVLIIDNGKPCNAQTPHSHNFLTRDGDTPANLRAIAMVQVLSYPTVRMVNGKAIKGTQLSSGFSITTADGQYFESKKLIIASGVKDNLPAIKGFAECWGISVLHCPYCHGYEVRHQKTGIIANGEMAFEFARLINNWTQNLILFTNGPTPLDSESALKLISKGITIVENEIEEIVHDKGKVTHLLFKDGSKQQLDAIYARGEMEQNTRIISDLNLQLNEQGYIITDAFKQSSQSGVYAAGDCTTPMRAIAESVNTGTMAGVFANKQLIEEEF